ncbi:MAG: sulfate adenylyltransferase [Vulcanimicrobiaceae bacterium]
MGLVQPYGPERTLKALLAVGDELAELRLRAKELPVVPMSTREASDLIMLGIGAFTPLSGFMGHDDWRRVCAELATAQSIFWPIPITLATDSERAAGLRDGQEVALVESETSELLGILKISEKYRADKMWQCRQVFGTTDSSHPGVANVMAEPEVNLAGSVTVLSESHYPERYTGLYLRPEQTRAMFAAKGWQSVAALQLRNPMHRSHEHLAKIAIEVCDGVFIHQKLGKLKPGDIPAEVRVRAVDVLMRNYFVADTFLQAGVPIEMRYGGPREALLDAVFRQNFGCSHLIIGRDHAGVGNFYGPFDSHKIFDQVPAGSLEIKPLKVSWAFYCRKCDGMACGKTCPHGDDDRLLVSGTMLRKLLSEGREVPEHFSRPEVLEILRDYYAGLEENVTVQLHQYARGSGA